MLADRDSLLVISAVAWVLLGGRIMRWGWGGRADRRTLGKGGPDESTWLCSGCPGYCCCRPSGLALRPFLAVFPGFHPPRPRNSLTTRLPASSCWASPSAPRPCLSQALPSPPHLPHSEPWTAVYRLMGQVRATGGVRDPRHSGSKPPQTNPTHCRSASNSLVTLEE